MMRRTGLVPADLLAGLALFFACNVVAAGVLSQAGWLAPAAVDDPEGQAWRLALRALAAQVLTQLPVAVFTLWRAASVPGGLRELGVFPRELRRAAPVAAVAIVGGVGLVMAVNIGVSTLGEMFVEPTPRIGHELLLAMQRSRSPAALALLLLVALVLAPVLEEIIFRGLLQTSLLSASPPPRRWSVIVIASAWFALAHGQPWQVLPPLFVLGLVLGWLYERTGNLLPCIVLHAVFNAINVGWALWLMEAGAT